MLKPRFIMVGGFLGAGKTTAILQLAERLSAQQMRVGLIMNDQSTGLVDTATVKSHGFATEEITGGCFCCKFNSLMDASSKLNTQTRPDVFVAEPVGSCTDLQATVAFPLRKLYGDDYAIAPFSVLVDPGRAMRVLGLQPGKSFSPKVHYIYEKQLEEADLLVINKCDTQSPEDLDRLQKELERRFPEAQVLRITAREGRGIEEWLNVIQSQSSRKLQAMDVDYDVYADGEALLGWVNVAAGVSGEEWDGNSLIRVLGDRICRRLDQQGIAVAHLKMTLAPATGNDLAVGNLVSSGASIELSHELADSLEGGDLLVNLRAEGAPEILQTIVQEVLSTLAIERGLSATMSNVESFRPGRPQPTHRVPNLACPPEA